jgi:virginiamycin B lyase
VFCGLALPGSAYAATIEAEYSIPSTVSNGSTGPIDITQADGQLYFLEANAERVARIDAQSGQITEYSPIQDTQPRAIVGLDGKLWVTEFGSSSIARFNPTNISPGTVAHYPIPSGTTPHGIAVGPDAALWFTEYQSSPGIGRLDPDTGKIIEMATPTGNAAGAGIVSHPNGNLYFIEVAGGKTKIGRVGAGSVITEFGPVADVVSTDASVYGIEVGPDGNVWFTAGADRIVRMTPDGGFVSFTVPTSNALPGGISRGSDGALWFTEVEAGKVGRITTTGAHICEFALPKHASSPKPKPLSITDGPGGTLWFTELDGNRIGKIVPPKVDWCQVMLFSKFFHDKGVDLGALIATALMSNAGSLVADTLIEIPGARALRLPRAVQRTLKPRERVTVRLTFPSVVRLAIVRALREGKRPTATMTLTGRDRNGNSESMRRSVLIRG